MFEKNKTHAWMMSVIISLGMIAPNLASAKKVIERPTPLHMAADAVVARPIMLAATALGTAIFVVTLPVSLIGGNMEEVGSNLVVAPFKSTFVRCLGCTRKNVKDPDHYYGSNKQ